MKVPTWGADSPSSPIRQEHFGTVPAKVGGTNIMLDKGALQLYTTNDFEHVFYLCEPKAIQGPQKLQ